MRNCCVENLWHMAFLVYRDAYVDLRIKIRAHTHMHILQAITLSWGH